MPKRSVTPSDRLAPDHVDASFAQARAAWPGLSLTRDRWKEALDQLDTNSPLEKFVLTDLFLAAACLALDPVAIAAFDAALETECRRAAKRHPGLDAGEVAAVLRSRMLYDPGTLRTYSARGSLGAWLGAAVVREAQNQLRGVARAHAREARASSIPEAPDPVIELLRTRFKVDFAEAFRGALRALGPRDRALLRLHLVEGMGLERLARHKQVGRSTAARWLANVRKQLLDHTRAALAQRGVGQQTLDSLLPELAPRLDVSIRRELDRDVSSES